jgi:hypothetical protein
MWISSSAFGKNVLLSFLDRAMTDRSQRSLKPLTPGVFIFSVIWYNSAVANRCKVSKFGLILLYDTIRSEDSLLC